MRIGPPDLGRLAVAISHPSIGHTATTAASPHGNRPGDELVGHGAAVVL